MSSRHATVIGGGIGGLTAAAALARHGWTVRLHERQPEIRAVGAGIYIWDNGLFALDSIGAFAEATHGAHAAPAIEARARTGRLLYRIGINGEGQPRCYTLLRDVLIAALVRSAREAGVELLTGSAATAVRADGTVEFDAGGTETADLVVVADGVHSRLRDSLDLAYRRIRMRQGAARLMIPASSAHVPSRDAVKHLEFFQGRRRLLYTPCTPDLVYLALVCDADDPAIRGSHVDVAQWRRSFPGLAPLLEATADIPIRWDTFEHVRLAAWSRGRVALLGDAAHAQPPYLGQGGGTAMTNAVALAATVSRPGLTLREALETWERDTRPGVERTQRTSYRMRLLNLVPDLLRDPLLTVAGRTSGFAAAQLAATRLRPNVTTT
jgi:2-polyprenyl-6-methoxyphenol hydroxylase-like FAD-dependent oxidoreductase